MTITCTRPKTKKEELKPLTVQGVRQTLRRLSYPSAFMSLLVTHVLYRVAMYGSFRSHRDTLDGACVSTITLFGIVNYCFAITVIFMDDVSYDL